MQPNEDTTSIKLYVSKSQNINQESNEDNQIDILEDIHDAETTKLISKRNSSYHHQNNFGTEYENFAPDCRRTIDLGLYHNH